MKVKCIRQASPRLSVGAVYEVLGIEADDYRILNDAADPCLYDPSNFTVVDATEPAFWISEIGQNGERYCYPREWIVRGFFEDYHDKVGDTVERFAQDYARLYGGKNA
jgi:hypothetical protein